MSKFDAAIRWLNSGISEWTKEERKFWHDHPFVPPTENESHRAAIRVLKAAAKVDKAIIESIGDAFCESYGGNVRGLQDPDYLVIRALLAALPDDTDAKEK